MEVQDVGHGRDLVLQHSLKFAELGGRLNVVEDKQQASDNSIANLAVEVRRLADAILTIEAERSAERSFKRWAVPILVSVVVGVLSTAVTLWTALASLPHGGGG